MLIKQAMYRMGRSRHNAIVINCLKHENGLTYKELYPEYCKMCEKEDIMPLALRSVYAIIRLAVARGSVRRERRGSQTRLWLVR